MRLNRNQYGLMAFGGLVLNIVVLALPCVKFGWFYFNLNPLSFLSLTSKGFLFSLKYYLKSTSKILVYFEFPNVKLTTETEAISGIIEDIKEAESQEKKRLTTDPIKSGFSIAGSTMRWLFNRDFATIKISILIFTN